MSKVKKKIRTQVWLAGTNLWIKVECADGAMLAKLEALLRGLEIE